MADKKISQLTGATTPLAGTEILPIVQSGVTKQVSIDNLTANKTVPSAVLLAGASAAINSAQITAGANSGVTRISLQNTVAAASDCEIYFECAGTNTGAIRYDRSDQALVLNSGGIDAVSIVGGLVTVNNGNLVIGTAGKGIDFSADPSAAGMTSELLDDYEEGTWTPAIVGGTSAGTGTYSAQAGSYTKIGNRVLFTCYVAWSAHTGSGNMSISGLPFTITNNNANYSSISVYLDAATALTAGKVIQARTAIGSTSILMSEYTPGGSGIGIVQVVASGGFMISGQYYV